MSTQAAALSRFMGGQPRRRPAWPQVLTVASGKGGSGTSTIAALAAIGAQSIGAERVMLVDSDESIGSLHLLLGLPTTEALDYTMTELLPNLELYGWGLRSADHSAGLRRAMLQRISGLFATADLVIIDAGSRASALKAAINAGSTRVLIVTETDPVAIASAYALMKLADSWQKGLRFEVIANRAETAAGVAACGVLESAAAEFLGRAPAFVGVVPRHLHYSHTAFVDVLSGSCGPDHPFQTTARAIAEYILRSTEKIGATSYGNQ